jgi:hypothetical protein
VDGLEWRAFAESHTLMVGYRMENATGW